MTWGICKKAPQLGAKVVTLSGPDGYIYDPDGVSSSEEKVNYLLEMRNRAATRPIMLTSSACSSSPAKAVGRQGR